MRIGFIGLGDQGGPIARALLSVGNELTVWARRPDAAKDLCDQGARWADDPASLAVQSDVVVLCVTDEEAVRDVLFGHGVLENMRPEAVLAIHTTMAPAASIELARQAEAVRLRYVEAPVSGSGKAVAERSLLLLTGGDEHGTRELHRLYAPFCNPVYHVGAAGAATRLKLVNNLKCAVDYAIAGDALALAVREGLPENLARDAMLAGSARSFALEAFDRIATQGRAEHVAAILAKDVELALDAFGEDVPEDWRRLAWQGVTALRNAGR